MVLPEFKEMCGEWLNNDKEFQGMLKTVAQWQAEDNQRKLDYIDRNTAKDGNNILKEMVNK